MVPPRKHPPLYNKMGWFMGNEPPRIEESVKG
jgi:hypothetical protein